MSAQLYISRADLLGENVRDAPSILDDLSNDIFAPGAEALDEERYAHEGGHGRRGQAPRTSAEVVSYTR